MCLFSNIFDADQFIFHMKRDEAAEINRILCLDTSWRSEIIVWEVHGVKYIRGSALQWFSMHGNLES